MAVDALELQLAAALQRYHALRRRAETAPRDPGATVMRTLGELGTALEQLRVAQEQIIESRRRTEELQQELAAQCAKYWELLDEMHEPYLVTRPDTTMSDPSQVHRLAFSCSTTTLEVRMTM